MPYNTQGGLEIFSFGELWSPFLLFILIAIAFLYITFIKKLEHQHERIPIFKKIMFFSGLLIFYAAQGSPLELIGRHYLFSIHMINDALSYLAFPPLIFAGLPSWLIRPLFKHSFIDKLVRFISNPILAILLFTALFSIAHLPTIFDWVMLDNLYINIFNFIFIILAFNMWWALATPLPEYDRLSNLQKVGCIFANGLLLAPLAAFTIFSSTIFYDTYVNAYRLIAWFQPLDDQQAGGLLFRILQEIVFGTTLGVIFFKWAKTERDEEEEEGAPLSNPNT